MRLSVTRERRKLVRPFAFARETIAAVDLLLVEVEQNGVTGRGEASPQAFLGQSLDGEIERLCGAWAKIEGGIERDRLAGLLPACGARNALDCALWDLEAKRTGHSVWEIAGLARVPQSLSSVISIGLGTPEWMETQAARFSDFEIIKVKLNAELVGERMRAVRTGAPEAKFLVDANEAWSIGDLARYAPILAEAGCVLIEQPLPRGADAALASFDSPIPLAADESCRDRTDLADVAGRYDVINIKLDKTGGLTEALLLARAAQDVGLDLMMGCMVATSLSMAPAFVAGSLCKYRDLDGASMLAEDREHAMRLSAGRIDVFVPDLWG